MATRPLNDLSIYILRRTQHLWYRGVGALPPSSAIEPPFLMRGRHRVFLGKDVLIRKNARIEIVEEYAGVSYNGGLEIGDGTVIENDVHIVSASGVSIGRHVLVAPRVAIVDCNHGFSDKDIPIMFQNLTTAPISIGDGTWIGIGATILKGTTIGRNCVVGAGAVVRGSIPDNMVVTAGHIELRPQR